MAAAPAAEWVECFGSMDEDIHSEVMTVDVDPPHSPPSLIHQSAAPTATIRVVAGAGAGGGSVSLCVRQPDWCLAVSAAESDARELRVLRACQLYAQRRFAEAIAAVGSTLHAQRKPSRAASRESTHRTPPEHPPDSAISQRLTASTLACLFGTRQDVVDLDVLARCHRQLGYASAAVRYQRELCALRPSIHSLLLLARWLKELERDAEGGGEGGVEEQMSEREAALNRCIDLCPVHAEAWHELGELFLTRTARTGAACQEALSPSTSLCRCSRSSFVHCARLCFWLVRDLTNFSLSLPRAPTSHSTLPSLAYSQYPAWLRSAETHLAHLASAFDNTSEDSQPRTSPSSSPPAAGCSRCSSICPLCWRGRLHRLACGPLLSLFDKQRLAEQTPTPGARRGKDKHRGATEQQRDSQRQYEGEQEEGEGEEEGEEETLPIDDFDALNL